jgi:energy-converting hydrogenase A subunit M
MPDRRQLDDQEAAQRRRAWLEDRRRWNRDLVVVLLRYAPKVDVARALDLLSAGELQRLAHLLAAATDLRQVARRIAADLQQHVDGRPAGPPPG